MSALPAAVQRRADAASRLLQQAEADRTGQRQPAAPAPAPIPAAPAAADVATLQRQLEETQGNLRRSNEAYDALKGKYDKELPRALADAKAARTELATATARITELEGLLKKKFESGQITSLTEAETRLLGPDVVAATAKIAREVAESTMRGNGNAELVAEFKALGARVDNFERQSDEAYFHTLDVGFPNWEAQNDDPKFIAWLNDRDPTTQRPRMDAIKRGEAARQGHYVVEIFRAFAEGREIGAQSQPGTQTELSRRVAPGPGGSGEPASFEVDAQGKRIWKGADIKAFYADKVRGVYRGRDAEARVLEEDIFAARREGRVRG